MEINKVDRLSAVINGIGVEIFWYFSIFLVGSILFCLSMTIINKKNTAIGYTTTILSILMMSGPVLFLNDYGNDKILSGTLLFLVIVYIYAIGFILGRIIVKQESPVRHD